MRFSVERTEHINFLPICLENYNRNFETEFHKVLQFLDVENVDISKIKIKYSNKNKIDSKMSDASRDQLKYFYNEHNNELFKLLGVDYPWN